MGYDTAASSDCVYALLCIIVFSRDPLTFHAAHIPRPPRPLREQAPRCQGMVVCAWGVLTAAAAAAAVVVVEAVAGAPCWERKAIKSRCNEYSSVTVAGAMARYPGSDAPSPPPRHSEGEEGTQRPVANPISRRRGELMGFCHESVRRRRAPFSWGFQNAAFVRQLCHISGG